MHNMKMKYLSLKNISWNWKSLFDKIVLQTITKIHKTPTFSHSMELMYISRKFSFTTYYKNSVKLSFLLKINLTEILSHTILTKISWTQRFYKKVIKELISHNILSVKGNFSFPHCVQCKNYVRKFSHTILTKISWN